MSSVQLTTVTKSDRAAAVVARIRAYWTLPAPLADAPPTWAQTKAYDHARLTAGNRSSDKPRSGLAKASRAVWRYGMFLPVNVGCAYVRWFFERPGRGLAVYAVWKMAIETGPGPWIADTIIRPALAVAGWVLL